MTIMLEASDAHWVATGALYFADEHALATLGLKLISGRNFDAAEIADRNDMDAKPPGALIVSRALAMKIFPNGDALGRSIYLSTYKQKVPIIGIVERLQQPNISSTNLRVEDAMLQPFRYIETYAHYVVRAKPGQLAAAMQSAQKQLLTLNRARINDKTRTMLESRRRAYRDDRGLAIILAIVSVVLLIVTAFGIIGVTSFWVSQRRRQIGIRRAMGATRTAILRYFQTENLMIACAGAALGILLALSVEYLDGRKVRDGAAECRLHDHCLRHCAAAGSARRTMARAACGIYFAGDRDPQCLTKIAAVALAMRQSGMSKPADTTLNSSDRRRILEGNRLCRLADGCAPGGELRPATYDGGARSAPCACSRRRI